MRRLRFFFTMFCGVNNIKIFFNTRPINKVNIRFGFFSRWLYVFKLGRYKINDGDMDFCCVYQY